MRQFANAVQNQPIDVSEEFGKQENHFFIASKAEEFDRSSASGKIRWKGQALKQRISYHQLTPNSKTTRYGKTPRQESMRTIRTSPSPSLSSPPERCACNCLPR